MTGLSRTAETKGANFDILRCFWPDEHVDEWRDAVLLEAQRLEEPNTYHVTPANAIKIGWNVCRKWNNARILFKPADSVVEDELGEWLLIAAYVMPYDYSLAKHDRDWQT